MTSVPAGKIRYVESVLTGRVRCVDGTTVVFVPYADEVEPDIGEPEEVSRENGTQS